jgi:hypothetical protein
MHASVTPVCCRTTSKTSVRTGSSRAFAANLSTCSESIRQSVAAVLLCAQQVPRVRNSRSTRRHRHLREVRGEGSHRFRLETRRGHCRNCQFIAECHRPLVRPPYTTRYDVPAVCTASIISGIGVIPISTATKRYRGIAATTTSHSPSRGVLTGRIGCALAIMARRAGFMSMYEISATSEAALGPLRRVTSLHQPAE